MSTTPSDTLHKRGTALGIAGQACLLGAWLLGVLGALSPSPIGLLGAVAAVTGIVLSCVAFFLMRARWGVLGPVAGWLLSLGVGASVVLFLAIPAQREWGKLGAMLGAIGALAVVITTSHLIAGVGLLRRGSGPLGLAVVAMQALVIVVGLVWLVAHVELGFVAAIASFAGHGALLAGFIAMRRP